MQMLIYACRLLYSRVCCVVTHAMLGTLSTEGMFLPLSSYHTIPALFTRPAKRRERASRSAFFLSSFLHAVASIGSCRKNVTFFDQLRPNTSQIPFYKTTKMPQEVSRPPPPPPPPAFPSPQHALFPRCFLRVIQRLQSEVG